MSLSSSLPSYKSDVESVFGNNNNTSPSAGNDIGTATKTWATSGIPMTVHTGTLAPGQAVAGFVTTTPGVISGTGSGGIDSSSPGTGLASAKTSLISTLTALFSNTNNTKTTAASGFCEAINDYFSKAQIMTNITGTVLPGVPVPAPAGPVGPSNYIGATETGGIDSPSPGPGLSAALTSYQSALSAVFSNTSNTAATTAQGIADACESFFLSAMITMTSSSGVAAGGPAVVNPVGGTGSTGPLGSPITTGTGTGTIT